MRRGRPIPPLVLTPEERQTLVGWTRRRTTARSLAARARIVLACAEGRPSTAIAAALGLRPQTVGKWRRRFLATRADGLADAPRQGAPRTVTDAAIKRVVSLTVNSTPRDSNRWSTRAMAQRTGLSRSTVHRIWRSFGLQPHQM